MFAVMRHVEIAGGVEKARPCATCDHHCSTHIRLIGMRCLHPLAPSTDPLYGLPPTCVDMRGGLFCGADGARHSSVQGSETKPQ